MIVYHGADGDKLMRYVGAKTIRLSGRKELCFDHARWQDCLKHGVDRRRKQAYVLQMGIELPSDPSLFTMEPRHGNPATFISYTNLKIVPVQLFVRAGHTKRGFEIFTVPADQIRSYLMWGWRRVNEALVDA